MRRLHGKSPFVLERSLKIQITGTRACRPLVATLLGLLLSNFGVISSNAPQYQVVTKFLLPLAVPLLLFTADMRSAEHSFCLIAPRESTITATLDSRRSRMLDA